jgi:Carboxypeptidase regulatory-like domain
VHVLEVPAPPRLAGSTTSTTMGVLTTQPEVPVAGRTAPTSVLIKPGSARLDGTVLGPSGPVEGATVEAQRYVGNATATIQATTAADGSFSIPGIRGGRYVVRAWRAPTMTETTAQAFFLAQQGTQTLNLQMTSYSGLKVSTNLNPETPFAGEPVNLAVEVTQPMVVTNGDVTQLPQTSVTVQLESTNFVPTGGGPSIATTGMNGEAILGITCTQSGPAPITLLVGGTTTVSVGNPFCVAAPTSTPATNPPPASTSPPQSTLPVRTNTTTGPSTTTQTGTSQPGSTSSSSTTTTPTPPSTTASGGPATATASTG